MAKVTDPVGRARAVKTDTQAARLLLDLEAELGMADHGPEWEAKADEAVRVLEQRFPDTDLRTPEAVEGPKGGGHAPSLSRKAKAAQDPKPRTPKTSSSDARGGRRKDPASTPQRSPRAPGRRTGATGRRRSTRRGGWRRRAVEQTGIPAAGRSATATLLQILGMTIGLALLYLLLTDAQRSARGRSAVETIARGVSGFVALVIAPVDPLASRSARSSANAPADGGLGSVADAAAAAAFAVGAEHPGARRRPSTRPPHAAAAGGRRPT